MATLTCLVVHFGRFFFFFNKALSGSTQTPSFNSSHSCLVAHLFSTTCVAAPCSSHLADMPASCPRSRLLQTEVHANSGSQFPDLRPLHLVPTHRTIHTTSAKKSVAMRARSASISSSRKRDKETGRASPAVPAVFLRKLNRSVGGCLAPYPLNPRKNHANLQILLDSFPHVLSTKSSLCS